MLYAPKIALGVIAFQPPNFLIRDMIHIIAVWENLCYLEQGDC